MALRGPLRTTASAPRRTRRRLPGHERRALIFDAALRAFAANGYDGAAMDQIATAAGISKAVVYDHVASKRELYTQLLHTIRDEIERTVEEALTASATEGEERVRVAVEGIYRYVQDHPEASQLLVLEMQGANISPIGSELEERITASVARTLGGTPELFAGHPARERQLTILAELLKSGVLGLVAWWCRHPAASRDELVERSVGVIWPAIERALADLVAGA